MIFLGELGVPTIVPVEVALLLVGSHAVHSPAMLLVSLALVTSADLLGTGCLYLAVRFASDRFLGRLLRRAVPTEGEGLARWRRRLGNHEAAIVFVARLLPLVRMPAAAGAALAGVRFRAYLLGAAPAALLWAGAPLILGYLFRADVQQFEARYATASRALLLALPALTAIGGLLWWIRRGASTLERLRRGRLVVSLGLAMILLGYVVTSIWAGEAPMAHGATELPVGALSVWLGGSTLLLLMLLVVAMLDLAAIAAGRGSRPSGAMAREAAATLVGAIVIAGLGSLLMAIENRYPAL